MRLEVLDHGHRRRARAFLGAARLVAGHPPDPVIKTALYRPDLFGAALLDLVNQVLRGPSFWTAAEREWVAAYTSRRNQCPFCAQVHGETTRVESKGTVDPADPATIRPELRAVLPLLDKLDDDLDRADLAEARAAGVPDQAIADVFAIGLIFDCINRVANAMDFEWVSDRHARVGARVIHLVKYRMPGVLLR